LKKIEKKKRGRGKEQRRISSPVQGRQHHAVADAAHRWAKRATKELREKQTKRKIPPMTATWKKTPPQKEENPAERSLKGGSAYALTTSGKENLLTRASEMRKKLEKEKKSRMSKQAQGLNSETLRKCQKGGRNGGIKPHFLENEGLSSSMEMRRREKTAAYNSCPHT